MVFLASPLEQYDIYPVLSLNLVLNNVVLYFIIAASLSPVILYLGTFKGNLISNWWGILSESLYRTILLMVENYIGPKYSVYFPLLYTIFHLVLFSNLIGLVPYSTTPTVEIVMVLSLALTLLGGVFILGMVTHRKYIIAAFVPSGTPLALILPMFALEILAYFTRTLSLGLRLAINMITGHILVKVIIGFIYSALLSGTSIILLTLPLFLLTMFLCLEILIAYLQAFIFTFIFSITVKDMALPSFYPSEMRPQK
uniref:ATP synthase subunit a n=1 Tax=Synchytrium taraxaci TaxID=1383262 RepID=A0A4P8NWU2_9FUNG|nr:ATP synthase F0 subunit a [Synchytrium taraxaci]